MGAAEDTLTADLEDVPVVVTTAFVATGPEDVDVTTMVFGSFKDPPLLVVVSTIRVIWIPVVDGVDGVWPTTKASLVEDVGDTVTSDEGCVKIDIEVDVVSTTTAGVEVTANGVVVDSTV